MAWFKKNPAQPPPAATPPRQPLPPAQLRVCGVAIQLIGSWQQIEVEPDGRAEFRSSSLPEQLFVMERRFVAPLDPESLRSVLLSMGEHSRSAILAMTPSATFEPMDYRTGNGQGEARQLASTPEVQAAFLHRGDARRVVSVSLYRHTPPSPKFTHYAQTIFDLMTFDTSPR